MEIIELKPSQITREILKLLNQLASTDNITISDAQRIIGEQRRHNHKTYILYDKGIPLGIASLIILDKLIHNGGNSALIEDVCIHKKYHRHGYGKILEEHLSKIATEAGCYKILLQCSENNVCFYKACGYDISGFNMRKDLK